MFHWFITFHSSSSPSISIPNILSISLNFFSSTIILSPQYHIIRHKQRTTILQVLIASILNNILSFNRPRTIHAIVSTLMVTPITDKSVAYRTIGVNFTIMCGHSSSSPFIPNTYSIAAVMLNMLFSLLRGYTG